MFVLSSCLMAVLFHGSLTNVACVQIVVVFPAKFLSFCSCVMQVVL